MKKYFLIFFVAVILFGLALFYGPKLLYRSLHKSLSAQEKTAIIEHSLALELPKTNTIVSDEANKLSEDAFAKVKESNYEEAISITLAGLKKFPQDFNLQADLASLLGDTAQITAEPLKSRMIQRSKQLFDRLLNEVQGQPKKVFYFFKNEHYFRLGMYKDQYELGIKEVADYWGTPEWNSIGFKGYYSQGVGAAYVAKDYLKQRNKNEAMQYAQKALVAWAQYFSYKNDYYNSYVHYALALGILGYKEEMMRALQRSAAIIKRDLDYFEFKDVTDFIEKYGSVGA